MPPHDQNRNPRRGHCIGRGQQCHRRHDNHDPAVDVDDKRFERVLSEADYCGSCNITCPTGKAAICQSGQDRLPDERAARAARRRLPLVRITQQIRGNTFSVISTKDL
jgi:hypothetical protein